MDKKLKKLTKRLKSRLPLLGARRRLKAAQALAGTSIPEVVPALLEARGDRKAKVEEAVHKALSSLTGKARDHLCSLWASERDPELESIIFEGHYIASTPLTLKYLTALKVGSLETVVDVDPGGVDVLVELLEDRDPQIASNAKEALKQLGNQPSIDRLCSLWAAERKPVLEDIIRAVGHAASSPSLLRAQTVFLKRKVPKFTLTDKIVEACLGDPDEAIVKGAVVYAIKCLNGDRAEIPWSFAKKHPDSIVPRVLHACKWYPQDPSERALLYFLAGDLDAYRDIDFDQTRLKYWYETGGQKLGEAIASGIRKSGDTQLLSIFKVKRSGRGERFTPKEVDLQIEILETNRRYPELLQLLPQTNFEQGRRILEALNRAGWRASERREHELQERLDRIAGKLNGNARPWPYAMDLYRDFRPMLLGDEMPPEGEAALLKWLEDKDCFRHRSAAVILLAENGFPSVSRAANDACRDDYWQVRMAAAVAELLHPGSLGPTNRELLSNDHVRWVQALLKMPSEGRLVGLAPAEIEKLEEGAPVSDPSEEPHETDDFFGLIKRFIPAEEAEYLLTLAEFLGTDIVVSEQEVSRIGETDAGMVSFEPL